MTLLESEMAGLKLIPLFLVLLTVPAESKGHRKDSWTYFSLVEEWPVSVCISFNQTKIGCKIPTTAQPWLIHGLWTEVDKGIPPSNCNMSTEFNMKYLSGVKEDLEKYWPSIRKDAENEKFWKHEWETHGRCATSDKATGDETKYFSRTLDLRKKFNVYDMLSKASIIPSPNKTYKLSDAEQAIRKSFRRTPFLQCVKEEGKSYLMRAHLCFDKALKSIDCPTSKVSIKPGPKPDFDCGKYVIYPEIKN